MVQYIALLLSVLLAALDQIFKQIAFRHLRPISTFPIIKDVLHFTYVENRGAAFGMMEGQKWLLVWGTAIVLLGMILLLMSGKIKKKLPMFIVAVIIGGGVGNLIDRIYRGFVVDYIHVKIINFAVFNFADICVVVGMIALVLYYLIAEFKGSKKTGGEKI